MRRLKKEEKFNPKKVLRESLLNRATKELEDDGLKFFTPTDNLSIDSDYLSLPEHITEVPSRELGEYLNAFTQQKMYLRTMLGYAEILVEDMKRKYHKASYEKYRSLSTSKMSETAKDREVNGDMDVLPYYEDYVDAKNKVKLIAYNIESIEDAIFLISREVSRRTGDFNEENRTHNVGRK